MDNYLNHRWPQGPGVQPPPVPSPGSMAPAAPPRPRLRRRWAVYLICGVLGIALLGLASFWAVNGIADLIAQAPPTLPDDPRPRVSRHLDRTPDWSPDELPWGEPDPSVALSTRPAGPTMSGREAYLAVLPTLVCVEAAHSSPFEGSSVGTGVVVTETGYVLTNYHIIEEGVGLRVQLLDRPDYYFSAQVIGFDEEFDIAVLKFDPDGVEITPAQLGDSDQLMVGDRVYAVGNPMGYLLGSMSVGIVSALNRDEDASGSPLGLIQTDASLNPGNSGGALLNEAGQVVGITCAKITGLVREDGDTVENAAVLEGMGLAIPISDAIPFVNHILATGESWRPAMGITCSAAQVNGRRGVRVADVTNAAAREAGLREDDLIVAANGSQITSLVELRRVLYRTGADSQLTCTVLRGGEELEITFPLMDSLKQQD